MIFATPLMMLIPVVSIIAVFTFISVAVWAENRRKEREAYYRYEFRKKMVEAGKLDADQLMALVDREEERRVSKQREGLKLAGFILLAVGLGFYFGIRPLTDGDVAALGFVPMVLGVAILGYALFFAPKSDGGGSAHD